MGGDSFYFLFTAKHEPEKMLYTREHLACLRGHQQQHTGVHVLCMHTAAGTSQHPRVPPSMGILQLPCYPRCFVLFSSTSIESATPGWVRGRMQARPQPQQRGATCTARSSAACWVKRDATAEQERARARHPLISPVCAGDAWPCQRPAGSSPAGCSLVRSMHHVG